MANISLLIATHRQYQMPSDTTLYAPIHVGAYNKEDLGYQKDCVGDNISIKNPSYCELTALYWGWKNSDADYLGLVHYRRYFANKAMKFKDGMNADDVAIRKEDIEAALQKADIIVPKKRRYYIETLYSHYANTLDKKHLDVTREIVEKLYPNQVDVFDATLKQTAGYMFNMFIMSKKLIDEYCSWVFPILDELYSRIDTTNMSSFEARYIGRVSELLFNVWLNTTTYMVIEKPVVYLEKVNWWVKGTSFLKAKFFKKKYDKSF